jgi:hypothetical protein
MSAHTDNSRVDDGGPAFPSVCMNDPCHPSSEPGMTLRDWFAGQALAGLLANEGHNRMFAPMADENGVTVDEVIAAMAFNVADAMLAARKGGDQ